MSEINDIAAASPTQNSEGEYSDMILSLIHI
jgi:hypothetical protein